LESYVLASNGDAHGAAESIHAIFQMAHSLENEPQLGAQHMRWVIHAQAIMAIEHLLPQVEFADADLRLLQADLQATDWRRALRLGLVGERALNLDAFRNPATLVERPVGPAILINNDDMVFYLQYAQALIDAAEQPWPQAIQVENQLSVSTRSAAAGSHIAAMQHVLTLTILQSSQKMFPVFARAEAASQCACHKFPAIRLMVNPSDLSIETAGTSFIVWVQTV
jgi:hypothetical protein